MRRKKEKRKLNLSPEHRAQLAEAMKARWAAKRAAAARPAPERHDDHYARFYPPRYSSGVLGDQTLSTSSSWRLRRFASHSLEIAEGRNCLFAEACGFIARSNCFQRNPASSGGAASSMGECRRFSNGHNIQPLPKPNAMKMLANHDSHVGRILFAGAFALAGAFSS